MGSLIMIEVNSSKNACTLFLINKSDVLELKKILVKENPSHEK